MNILRKYYVLTKPGIIFGNTITAVGGFVLASKGEIDFILLVATLLGLGLIVGSGCVLNNFLDRMSDRLMNRTKHRPLAQKVISEKGALIYSFTLLFLGWSLLTLYTNWLATLIALVGFIVYVLFYSFLKYKTVHGTLIGSISGAVPPVVGYTAVNPSLDMAAFLLFAIVVLWQMPHFFAIALYRMEEYRAASIPVLPLVKGIYRTKVQMAIYVIAFCIAACSLTFLGYLGNMYLVALLLLSSAWFVLSMKGFKAKKDKLWARKMFLLSLVVIMGLCGFIAIDQMFIHK